MHPDDEGFGKTKFDLAPSKEDRKAEKKRLKQLEDTLETKTLDPWERYRVLLDLLDMYNDISEMADRKTRFALVILGAVNTVNAVVVARPEMFFEASGFSVTTAAWLGIYLILYVVLSLFLFVQAIGALKPRVSTLLTRVDHMDNPQKILGLRFISHIRDTPFEEYYERWRSARFADVNREIALSLQMVVTIVTEKYRALQRLYAGLLVLVFLTAGLITVLIYLRIQAGPILGS
jgi:hypothetical protein